MLLSDKSLMKGFIDTCKAHLIVSACESYSEYILLASSLLMQADLWHWPFKPICKRTSFFFIAYNEAQDALWDSQIILGLNGAGVHASWRARGIIKAKRDIMNSMKCWGFHECIFHNFFNPDNIIWDEKMVLN